MQFFLHFLIRRFLSEKIIGTGRIRAAVLLHAGQVFYHLSRGDIITISDKYDQFNLENFKNTHTDLGLASFAKSTDSELK